MACQSLVEFLLSMRTGNPVNGVVSGNLNVALKFITPPSGVFSMSSAKVATTTSGAIDLAKNIKEYKDIDAYNTENLVGSVYPQLFYLTSDVLSFDDVIYVTSTYGWPNTYGLLKINDEIITYTGITTNSFTGCIRGFSGIDQIKSFANSEFLNFSSTIAEEHSAGTIVYNLSTLFIQEFFKKFKSEFLPGFESRTFVSGLSTKNILSRAKDFYITKGTDVSYKLLFKILYGTIGVSRIKSENCEYFIYFLLLL